jgi:hypothetical protein
MKSAYSVYGGKTLHYQLTQWHEDKPTDGTPSLTLAAEFEPEYIPIDKFLANF